MSDFNAAELVTASDLGPAWGSGEQIPAQDLLGGFLFSSVFPGQRATADDIPAEQLVPDDMGWESGLAELYLQANFLAGATLSAPALADLIASTLSGGATQTADATVKYAVDASLSGGATLAPDLTGVFGADASLAGGATLNGVLGLILGLDASVSGGATQTADLVMNLTASLTGGATYTHDIVVKYAGTSSLAGSAALSAPNLVEHITSAFSGDSSFNGDTSINYAIDATPTGGSTFDGETAINYKADAALTGDATVVANVILHTKLGFCFFYASGDLNGEISIRSFSWPFANLFAGSDLTANPSLAFFGLATLAGGGTLFAPVLYDQFTLGSALSNAGASVLSDVVLKLAATSSMPAGATVLADLLVTMLVASSMTGDAQMVSDIVVALAADSTLAAGASLTAPNLVENIGASLMGGASVTAEATRIIYIDAVLEGKANYGATTLLWTSHPFHPIPFPAFNSGFFLQQFIDATGVSRGFIRTPTSDEMLIVLNPKSQVVETGFGFSSVFGFSSPFRGYGYYYSTVQLLSDAEVNPFNRTGG